MSNNYILVKEFDVEKYFKEIYTIVKDVEQGIINDGDVYCKHCGQRLSWKQNEDEKES